VRSFAEFADAWHRYLGKGLSHERTKVGGRPADDSEVLEKLHSLPQPFLRLLVHDDLGGKVEEKADITPEETLERLKESAARGQHRGERSSVLADHEIDAMDRKYSNEVIDKLDTILSRASALEAMHLQRIPNTKARRCFEEAMSCYLYGFNMACAAMCRALLEAALKEVMDPERQLVPTKEDKNEGGRRASYFLKLVDNARLGGKLCKDLGEQGGPADQVKKAGNTAVHDADKFAAEFPAEKVEWLLDMTRKILAELYGAE
jgi:hypothetical protein